MTDAPDPFGAEPRGLGGYPVTPPALPRPVMFDQRWRDVTFVHWPVRPDSVAHMYPPGTRPDVFADGMSYVALVPFAMSKTAVGTSLPVPYFGTFLETNLRMYSIDDAGRHGVVFRSLESERLAVVALTRVGLGVPYAWARMRMTRSGDQVTYHSVRRWPRRGLSSRLTISVGDVVEPTPLEVWLTARWGAHTRKVGRTWWVPVEHAPWPLHAAGIVEFKDDLLVASNVPTAGDRLRALFSPGVHARLGRPILVQ